VVVVSDIRTTVGVHHLLFQPDHEPAPRAVDQHLDRRAVEA
jgi:hypothetical protein